ncbi:hypothetical protein SPRG_22164 [Saprolegnia parasitica CBS 223.65]|uniref:Chromatin target of PRMT1 protein C-terminal domain-containing protein n=1 Tax=Saprolegnia parasitica (strain CBS 223.65) TaxID=695850 RepID=A0A067CR42_SAPPC|nr:hypothetical protein SPRG_22164 [Saprolegnia parasitica CBS 223.65]KDO29262.1 hypothetical protein SPRG_22164 [Saprolegnia parasitica CBS 223.65]|eukprot:XP_012200158.1 hypothetical protein SPRG_22164 [Saprolegnia parasitica CBS 223.65]
MAGRRAQTPKRPQPKKAAPRGKGVPKTSDLIGVASVPLSERFTQLHAAPAHTAPKKKKKAAVVVGAAQKAKRQNTVNARRGIAPAPLAKQQLKAKQTAALAKPSLSRTKGGVKINNLRSGKRQGAVKRLAKPTPVKKEEDLDMDMDTYWFEAGKGPDPKQKRLDDQMDQYWASKPVEVAP